MVAAAAVLAAATVALGFAGPDFERLLSTFLEVFL
jgi:hypothetical protein